MGADLNNIVKFQRLSDEHVQFLIYQLLRGLKARSFCILFFHKHTYKLKQTDVMISYELQHKLSIFISVLSSHGLTFFPPLKQYIHSAGLIHRVSTFPLLLHSFCLASTLQAAGVFTKNDAIVIV